MKTCDENTAKSICDPTVAPISVGLIINSCAEAGPRAAVTNALAAKKTKRSISASPSPKVPGKVDPSGYSDPSEAPIADFRSCRQGSFIVAPPHQAQHHHEQIDEVDVERQRAHHSLAAR